MSNESNTIPQYPIPIKKLKGNQVYLDSNGAFYCDSPVGRIEGVSINSLYRKYNKNNTLTNAIKLNHYYYIISSKIQVTKLLVNKITNDSVIGLDSQGETLTFFINAYSSHKIYQDSPENKVIMGKIEEHGKVIKNITKDRLILRDKKNEKYATIIDILAQTNIQSII